MNLKVREYKYDYTECKDDNGQFCYEVVEKNTLAGTFDGCKCSVTLEIPEDMEVFVFFLNI